MDTHPSYQCTGIPGIGTLRLYDDGRIILGDDTRITHEQLSGMVQMLTRAAFASRDIIVAGTLRRDHEQTSQLEALADFN